MKPEAELRRRLRALATLGEAVTAMKTLSAHHFREARKAVDDVRAYREGVERIVASAGPLFRPGEHGAGLLVIGAELGLCGSYNVTVVGAALSRRHELGDGPTFCVGHRAATQLGRRGVALSRSYGAPTSVGGITGLLLQLAEDVLTSYASDRLESFDIVSVRFAGVGTTQPQSVRLLPFDAKPSAVIRPARYVAPDEFRAAAARELLYITLYDVLLDALAAEHGARLLATQAAEQWLDDRAVRLRRYLSAALRESSTQEMIEIASGARARPRDHDA